jgi:hypothetical protein
VGTAASVVEKSDDYDDGNWHAKQPEQDRAAHERLLFCFLFESWRLLNGQASASFRAKSHQASNARFTFSRRRFSRWNDPYRNKGGSRSARRGLASNERGASHALGRISEQTRATGATGADRSELLQLLQTWGRRAVTTDLEAHSRNEDRARSLSGSPEILRSKPARLEPVLGPKCPCRRGF